MSDDYQRQTAQERLMAMGYKQKDENEWENDMQYTERMCGMLALWAAVLQTIPEGNLREVFCQSIILAIFDAMY